MTQGILQYLVAQGFSLGEIRRLDPKDVAELKKYAMAEMMVLGIEVAVAA